VQPLASFLDLLVPLCSCPLSSFPLYLTALYVMRVTFEGGWDIHLMLLLAMIYLGSCIALLIWAARFEEGLRTIRGRPEPSA
jgi:hypothetical protein